MDSIKWHWWTSETGLFRIIPSNYWVDYFRIIRWIILSTPPPPLEIKIQLDYSVEWEMLFGWDYLREVAGSIHLLSSLSIIETWSIKTHSRLQHSKYYISIKTIIYHFTSRSMICRKPLSIFIFVVFWSRKSICNGLKNVKICFYKVSHFSVFLMANHFENLVREIYPGNPIFAACCKYRSFS